MVAASCFTVVQSLRQAMLSVGRIAFLGAPKQSLTTPAIVQGLKSHLWPMGAIFNNTFRMLPASQKAVKRAFAEGVWHSVVAGAAVTGLRSNLRLIFPVWPWVLLTSVPLSPHL